MYGLGCMGAVDLETIGAVSIGRLAHHGTIIVIDSAIDKWRTYDFQHVCKL